MTEEKNCFKCGYEWLTRVAEPKECPRCKTRLDIEKENKEDEK